MCRICLHVELIESVLAGNPTRKSGEPIRKWRRAFEFEGLAGTMT
jgi:hypothetical protein